MNSLRKVPLRRWLPIWVFWVVIAWGDIKDRAVKTTRFGDWLFMRLLAFVMWSVNDYSFTDLSKRWEADYGLNIREVKDNEPQTET